jgi:putative SOS response-associated peptidase YedK
VVVVEAVEYDAWLREMWNSRRQLRALMHPHYDNVMEFWDALQQANSAAMEEGLLRPNIGFGRVCEALIREGL